MKQVYRVLFFAILGVYGIGANAQNVNDNKQQQRIVGTGRDLSDKTFTKGEDSIRLMFKRLDSSNVYEFVSNLNCVGHYYSCTDSSDIILRLRKKVKKYKVVNVEVIDSARKWLFTPVLLHDSCTMYLHRVVLKGKGFERREISAYIVDGEFWTKHRRGKSWYMNVVSTECGYYIYYSPTVSDKFGNKYGGDDYVIVQ